MLYVDKQKRVQVCTLYTESHDHDELNIFKTKRKTEIWDLRLIFKQNETSAKTADRRPHISLTQLY